MHLRSLGIIFLRIFASLKLKDYYYTGLINDKLVPR